MSTIKIANEEILKKIEEIFMTFQSFMLKSQTNKNQTTTTNELNHKQNIYTVPSQACPPYYPNISSIYSLQCINYMISAQALE